MIKVFGAFFVIAPFLAAAEWIDEPERFREEVGALLFFLPIFWGIGYLGLFRFGTVDCDDYEIEIRRNGIVIKVAWLNVSSLRKIPCTTPPVYRMSFDNGIQPVYFLMSVMWYLSIGFWSWDFSGFEEYARARMTSKPKSTPQDPG